MRLFALLVEQPARIRNALRGITEIGKPYEPQRVLYVALTAN
jgi:hypothetical protein